MPLMTLDPETIIKTRSEPVPVTDAAPVQTIHKNHPDEEWEAYQLPDWYKRSPIQDAFYRYGYYYS